MPTPTYTLIDSVTLSSSAASVTFSSITQDYRDLVLVAQPLSLTASDFGGSSNITFNGDTGTNYSYVRMTGNGSTTDSSSGTQNRIPGPFQNNSTYNDLFICQIMDYSATDKHKTVLMKKAPLPAEVGAFAHRWANTAAITSITFTGISGDFAAGSTFYLYGIEA